MTPGSEDFLGGIGDYEMAPRAYIDPSIYLGNASDGFFSLLSHLKYDPAERGIRGSCKNGWAWAATGVMGIALDVGFNITREVLYVESSGTCDGKTPCYSTIQGDIGASSTVATIQVVGTYDEDISLNTSKNMTLKGGYDFTFTTQSSNTIVNSLTISNGYTVVDRLILQ
jgi:hypothetical protein